MMTLESAFFSRRRGGTRDQAFAVMFAAGLLMAATARAADEEGYFATKVQLDVSQLDSKGLIGPEDGKRALSYEFCIPEDGVYQVEVSEIDTTAQFMADSKGRIGCSDSQTLVIGSTGQFGWKLILTELAYLPYVEKIVEAHFE